MKAIPLFCLLLASTSTFAQVFSNKEVGKKNAALADSLKNSEYPYVLPIWGDKAAKKGFNLPYSAGLSAQYFGQESLLIIDNLNVGFNNGPMYNLDGIVRFEEAKAKAGAFTVRPDVWLFPFLNVYGILGKAQASTTVNFGVWVPDSTGVEKEVLSTGTVIEFNTSTFGLGITPTIGVGGGFLALDMNVAWTDVPQLAKPARTFVFGPRLGKNFKLKKERAVTVWTGAFRVAIASKTDGSISLSEVFDDGGGEIGAKIDQGILKVGNAQQQVDTWWAGLTPKEQNNPVNKAKYERANSVLARTGQILDAADAAVNTISTSTVQYSMDKDVKDAWNFIVGGQYQFNKHFMVRFEYGFLGSRNQFITGVQYRFGL
jgi:opacity protein-like surface antigen